MTVVPTPEGHAIIATAHLGLEAGGVPIMRREGNNVCAVDLNQTTRAKRPHEAVGRVFLGNKWCSPDRLHPTNRLPLLSRGTVWSPIRCTCTVKERHQDGMSAALFSFFAVLIA